MFFYINADDSHKGVITKLELGEKYGFQVIVPGYQDFQPSHFEKYLNDLVNNDDALGKVLILDTVKKFTNMMDKSRASKFGEVVRLFSLHGGTVIGLAHVNKHKDAEGKSVYSGTTDLKDDGDCAYIIEVTSEDKTTGVKTVAFGNLKNRGDVALEAAYEYQFGERVAYLDKLNSVRSLDEREMAVAKAKKLMAEKLERNQEACDAIRHAIKSGQRTKTGIIKTAHEASGLSRTKLRKALADHTGPDCSRHQFWTVEAGEKNAQFYTLTSAF